MIAAVAVVLTLLAAYHVYRARCKLDGQRAVYALAAARARATKKPLVVVGDPRAPKTLNAAFGPGYGCGDLCVDIAGAPSCPRALAAPVLEWARRAADDSVVVFESEVLMYVPRAELAATLRELRRVSGGDLFSSGTATAPWSTPARCGAHRPAGRRGRGCSTSRGWPSRCRGTPGCGARSTHTLRTGCMRG